MFRDEQHLLATLDAHDRLIAACAAGTITFRSFLDEYDSFPMRFALDGHESDEAEREWLSKHMARCAVHWRVWNEVLASLCSDDVATDPNFVAAARFGSEVALRRLQGICSDSFGAASGRGALH